ncbi:MAG: TRAM domain-containing protein [Micromonosporaceae bacterium]|nr:TRAM domain-containing protein [Micromonosporaceae bacterium]
MELTVGPAAHGGHCVARHDNRVVFVRHALPGERVRARITETRSRYLRADAVEVLSASPDRVAAPCPYAGPGRCGGCDFQHVTAEGQRRLKTQVVREQLVRLGGLAESEVADVSVSPLPGGPLGWRTRVRYAVDDAGRVGFRRHRSHEVLPVDRCLIAAPAIQDSDVTGRRWPDASAVECAAGAEGVSVLAVPTEGRAWLVAGEPEVVERAAGRVWRLPPTAFWQVHPAAADTFAACVLDLLDPRPGERVVDLYGGVGLFAAPIAERVGPDGEVTLVESDRAAAAAAKAALADLPQVRVVRGRVERLLGRLTDLLDLAVLDPPRTGAGAAVVEALVAVAPRAVAYVACDPGALARDVSTFRAAGWRLAEVRAFDAFPMTHHVECIALLTP